jgi:hypothetical protein
VWLRYLGGQLTRVRAGIAARRAADRKRALETRRERGSVPREEYLAAVQRRREEASRLRGLGVAIEEIASRLRPGVRSVHRWLLEIRCVPSPSALSDFEGPRERVPRQMALIVDEPPSVYSSFFHRQSPVCMECRSKTDASTRRSRRARNWEPRIALVDLRISSVGLLTCSRVLAVDPNRHDFCHYTLIRSACNVPNRSRTN